jgi:hypothetical protein
LVVFVVVIIDGFEGLDDSDDIVILGWKRNVLILATSASEYPLFPLEVSNQLCLVIYSACLSRSPFHVLLVVKSIWRILLFRDEVNAAHIRISSVQPLRRARCKKLLPWVLYHVHENKPQSSVSNKTLLD